MAEAHISGEPEMLTHKPPYLATYKPPYLGSGRGPYLRRAGDVDGLVHVFINLPNGGQEVALQDPLQRR